MTWPTSLTRKGVLRVIFACATSGFSLKHAKHSLFRNQPVTSKFNYRRRPQSGGRLVGVRSYAYGPASHEVPHSAGTSMKTPHSATQRCPFPFQHLALSSFTRHTSGKHNRIQPRPTKDIQLSHRNATEKGRAHRHVLRPAGHTPTHDAVLGVPGKTPTPSLSPKRLPRQRQPDCRKVMKSVPHNLQ